METLAQGVLRGSATDASLSETVTGETAGGRFKVPALANLCADPCDRGLPRAPFGTLPIRAGAIVIAAVLSLMDVDRAAPLLGVALNGLLPCPAGGHRSPADDLFLGMVLAVVLSVTFLL